MADASDRTIPATPRRREAARQQGMMPLSSLPAWLAAVLVAVGLRPAWWAATVPAAADMLRATLRAAAHEAAFDPALFLDMRLFLPTIGVVLASGTVGIAVRVLLNGTAWRPAGSRPPGSGSIRSPASRGSAHGPRSPRLQPMRRPSPSSSPPRRGRSPLLTASDLALIATDPPGSSPAGRPRLCRWRGWRRPWPRCSGHCAAAVRGPHPHGRRRSIDEAREPAGRSEGEAHAPSGRGGLRLVAHRRHLIRHSDR